VQLINEDQSSFLRRNTRGFLEFGPAFGGPRVFERLIAWFTPEDVTSYLFKVFLQLFLVIVKRGGSGGSFG
jgi:hypothetical protein